MTQETFASFEAEWRKLAPNPEGFAAFIDKMIALVYESSGFELTRIVPTPGRVSVIEGVPR